LAFEPGDSLFLLVLSPGSFFMNREKEVWRCGKVRCEKTAGSSSDWSVRRNPNLIELESLCAPCLCLFEKEIRNSSTPDVSTCWAEGRTLVGELKESSFCSEDGELPTISNSPLCPDFSSSLLSPFMGLL
jgi:hypothetical protein